MLPLEASSMEIGGEWAETCFVSLVSNKQQLLPLFLRWFSSLLTDYGGHQYANQPSSVNGIRFYLNAVLIPAQRSMDCMNSAYRCSFVLLFLIFHLVYRYVGTQRKLSLRSNKTGIIYGFASIMCFILFRDVMWVTKGSFYSYLEYAVVAFQTQTQMAMVFLIALITVMRVRTFLRDVEINPM